MSSIACFIASFALAIRHSSATLGTLDTDSLLKPNLEQDLFVSDGEHYNNPWSHKPHCTISKSLPTLNKEYCVYTSNTTGPHGLSLIIQPSFAQEAAKNLNGNPVTSFLTQADAERLYLQGQPWKIVDMPDRGGKGVIATRKINQYDTFMVDQAAVVVDLSAEQALTGEQNGILLNKAVDQLLVPGMIRDMSSAHGGKKIGNWTEGRLEEDIMKTNAFGGNLGDTQIRTLYPLISRINHACDPNSFVMFSKSGIAMAIKAYRDIVPGEEITISYLLLGSPFAKRQAKIEKWGFKCTCNLCSLPDDERQASDLRRTMIMQAEVKTMELAQAYKLDEAIALAEECVDMIKEEKLYSMLTDEYAMLAMLWLEKGDHDKAEMYGEMTRQLLADLGYLGIGKEKETWSLDMLLKSIGGLGGMGKEWKKGPLRG